MQPKREVPTNSDSESWEDQGDTLVSQIMLDVDDVKTSRNVMGSGAVGVVAVEALHEPKEGQESYAIRTLQTSHDSSEWDAIRDFPWDLTLDRGNYITCEDDLPTFPLPEPYLVSSFENLQQLCAVQCAGGLSGANAGGYCHRSNPHGGEYGFENYV